MRKHRACPRTCVRMAVLHWDTYSRHVTCVRNTSMEYSSILIHNTCMYCAYIISATMVKSRTYVRTYNPLWNQWRLKPSRYTWVVVVLPLISTLVKSLLTTLCSTSPRFVDSHTHRNKSEKLYTWGIDTNPTDSTFQSTHLYTDN